MVLILNLRKDLTHSWNPSDNRVFPEGRLKCPEHRLGPAVHVCLSVGRLFKIQGFSPSKAANPPVGKTLWEKSHLQDSISDADPDQRFAKVFGSGMSLGSLWEWVRVPTHSCLHSHTSSVYRKQLPWVAFLKTQVLYNQVNFLSVLFAWSKSDILWPVRFMASFPHSFSPPINTSGYKPHSDSLLFCLWLLSQFARNKYRGILKHISVACNP